MGVRLGKEHGSKRKVEAVAGAVDTSGEGLTDCKEKKTTSQSRERETRRAEMERPPHQVELLKS